jgi:hypothetical protein
MNMIIYNNMSLLDKYLKAWILLFPLISLFGFLITIVEHPFLVVLVTLFLIIGIYCIYSIDNTFEKNKKLNYFFTKK